MLILSWNVAGLSTTVNRIHHAYGSSSSPSSSTLSKSTNSNALATWLDRHGVGIWCVQEHKIPLEQLKSRSEPRQASTIPGYESYWSCCTDAKHKGLNGCVTYVRKNDNDDDGSNISNFQVVSADAAPLGSPDLDQLGRCIMTDHGAFVLFNVYVPCNGGHALAFKMRFLRALEHAMRRQSQRKPVILVGDLNIAHTKRDIYWKDRIVHIDRLPSRIDNESESENDNNWPAQVLQHWPRIEQAVATTQRVVPTKTTNPKTGVTFEKYRLCVQKPNNGEDDTPTTSVFLGSHEQSPDHCLYRYDWSAQAYIDDNDSNGDNNDNSLQQQMPAGEPIPCREARAVRVGVLAELMNKLADCPQWDDDAWVRRTVVPRVGVTEQNPPRKWLTNLLSSDENKNSSSDVNPMVLVDAFRHWFPEAEDRFTCWNQYLNCRYSNEGSRIDYTLVDRRLVPFLAESKTLSTGKVIDTTGGSPRKCVNVGNDQSARAAHAAATARGHFQPAAFEGGGIVEPTQRALDSQFPLLDENNGGIHQTGIVYTPPSFSDHVAVALRLSDDLLLEETTNSTPTPAAAASTRKAQPHKQQTSISSFFGKKRVADNNVQQRNVGASSKLRRTTKPPAKASILKHFKKR